MRDRGHVYAGWTPEPKGRVRFKNMFSPPTPPSPTPAPPPVMPDPNSPANMDAARRASVKANEAGRSSTTLTTATTGARASQTLAGGAMTNKLGGS